MGQGIDGIRSFVRQEWITLNRILKNIQRFEKAALDKIEISEEQGDIEIRLLKIFSTFSNERKSSIHSSLAAMWPHDVEVLEYTEPLEAIELEFEINIDQETSWELYHITVREAAGHLSKNFNLKKEDSPSSVLTKLSPADAMEILTEMWYQDHVSRIKVKYAIDNLEWKRNRPQ